MLRPLDPKHTVRSPVAILKGDVPSSALTHTTTQNRSIDDTTALESVVPADPLTPTALLATVLNARGTAMCSSTAPDASKVAAGQKHHACMNVHISYAWVQHTMCACVILLDARN